MTVYRHQGKWMYDFMVKRKRYKDSGYPTKQEAKDAEAEARKNVHKMNSDFIALCESRLRDLRTRRTGKYFKENEKLIKNLIKKWAMKKIITRSDVETYLQERTKESVSATNKELRFIKALFNHGKQWEIFFYNPADNVKPVGVEKNKKKIPTQDEIQKMLKVASPKQKLYLLMAIHSLGRSSSINNLKWEDVNGETLTLKTRKAKNSNVKEVSIPINDVLRDALSQISRTSEYVFVKRTGERFQYRSKLIPSLCRKAKVPRYTLHCIRHFSACKLDSMGVPLCDIQALLGHESPTTTAIYLQSLRGSTSESVKKLEGIHL